MKITGYAAIEVAEANGLTLQMYNSPIEDARDGLTPDEARKIASEDPRLIYIKESPAAQLARARWAKPDADRDQPRRAGKLGGRPKKLILCPRGCGTSGGVVEMRRHHLVCPASPHTGQHAAQ